MEKTENQRGETREKQESWAPVAPLAKGRNKRVLNPARAGRLMFGQAARICIFFPAEPARARGRRADRRRVLREDAGRFIDPRIGRGSGLSLNFRSFLLRIVSDTVVERAEDVLGLKRVDGVIQAINRDIIRDGAHFGVRRRRRDERGH